MRCLLLFFLPDTYQTTLALGPEFVFEWSPAASDMPHGMEFELLVLSSVRLLQRNVVGVNGEGRSCTV